MLNDQEAETLMAEFIALRNEKNTSSEAMTKFRRHETKCINSFAYIIHMHANRYKNFSNHDDLVQEGYEALMKAMANYKPGTSSFFYWSHRYIGTRISRQANLHTTIRFPLKIAKEQIPKREFELPLLIEETFCPDKQAENLQIVAEIKRVINTLRGRKRKIIDLYFGFTGDKPASINKICETLDLSRIKCTEILQSAIDEIKFVIQV
jgi:RNA polymerase sigma factor (sigma-70 family)